MAEQHSYNSGFAKKYGIEEAILFNDFAYWCSENKQNGINCKVDENGIARYWTFNSLANLEKKYEEINIAKIRRAIKHLVDEGLIIISHFNKLSFDRTNWYAITEKGEMELMRFGCRFHRNIYFPEISFFPENITTVEELYSYINLITDTSKMNLSSCSICANGNAHSDATIPNTNTNTNNTNTLSTSNLNSDTCRESENSLSFVSDSLSPSEPKDSHFSVPSEQKASKTKKLNISEESSKPKDNSETSSTTSFPKDFYDQCYLTYKQCFNALKSNNTISGSYYAPIKICNSRLKHWFEVFGLEKTLEGIRNASKDDFCIKTLNFNLQKILSDGVFPDRVNNRVTHPNKKPPSKTKAVYEFDGLINPDYSKGFWD